MSDFFSLTKRRVLITGAAGAIGAATAHLFDRAGASLLLSDTPERCMAAPGTLRRLCADGEMLVADMADPEAAAALGRRALTLGPLDGLVCAAGIQGPVGSLSATSPSDVDRVLAVNLTSSVALTGVIAPAMAARGGGSIVLVASIAGLRGNKAIGLYGLSKAALAQLARNLAVEWGPHGVRANAISPGLIDTPFADGIRADAAYYERRMGLTPLRRMGSADEVAASILYLASPAAGFVTGHNLVADGGTTISDGN